LAVDKQCSLLTMGGADGTCQDSATRRLSVNMVHAKEHLVAQRNKNNLYKHMVHVKGHLVA
jgi:cellobiose-specific phosphotransferase system component IIA